MPPPRVRSLEFDSEYPNTASPALRGAEQSTISEFSFLTFLRHLVTLFLVMRTRNHTASEASIGQVFHPTVGSHPRFPEWETLNAFPRDKKHAQQLACTMLAWAKRQKLLCVGVQGSSLVFAETGGRRYTLFAFLCVPEGYTKFEDFLVLR